MVIPIVSIDLAEHAFYPDVVNQHRVLVYHCDRKRHGWMETLRERIDPEAVIAMEVCGYSYHWGQLPQSHG